MDKRIILAFTGGLQSTVCLHWLYQHSRAEVAAVVVELGQRSASWELGEFAVELGAESAHVEDCREEFCRDYAFRALRASAVYEKRYLLSGALARPLIAAVLVRMARQEGYRHLALGASRNSNDLARFRANVAALGPELEIIGPEQIPPLQSRRAAIEYAQQNNIVPREGIGPTLSFDINLWGAAVAVDPSLSTWEPLPDELYQITTNPAQAPAEPEEMVLRFERGTPVAIDDRSLPPHELVAELNKRAGRHGVGRTEALEDRLVGVKAREVYETPGATSLMVAHTALEELTLDYETLQTKCDTSRRYATLVYEGGWFSNLRKALDAFTDVTQERVSGEVKLRLHAGRLSVLGRRSPHSLYNGELVRQDSAMIGPGRDYEAVTWRLAPLSLESTSDEKSQEPEE